MPVLSGKGIVRKKEPHSHPFTSEDRSAAWLFFTEYTVPDRSGSISNDRGRPGMPEWPGNERAGVTN